jgi:hypothetical protein
MARRSVSFLPKSPHHLVTSHSRFQIYPYHLRSPLSFRRLPLDTHFLGRFPGVPTYHPAIPDLIQRCFEDSITTAPRRGRAAAGYLDLALLAPSSNRTGGLLNLKDRGEAPNCHERAQILEQECLDTARSHQHLHYVYLETIIEVTSILGARLLFCTDS